MKAFLGFVVGIFVARYLGAERYGVLMYALGVVALFSFISSLGMDSILVRELVRDKTHEKSLLGSSIILRLAASLISIVFVLILLALTHADRETWLLTLMCCSTYFFLSGEGLRAFFEARVEGKKIVMAETLQCIICSALRIYFIAVHANIYWFCLCCILESFLTVLFFAGTYRRMIGSFRGWKFNRPIARGLLKAGLPLVLSGLAITIYSQMDKVMLKNMLGSSGNEQVGLYTVALRIMPFVTLVPHMLSKSLFPIIALNHGVSEKDEAHRYQLYLDLMLWVGIALSGVLFLFAKPIMHLYGSEFIGSIIILQVVCWQGIFFCTSLSSGSVFIAKNIHQYAVIRNLAGSVVNVAMNFYLIPRYQALGAAIATVFSLFVSSVFIHLFIPVYRSMFWSQCRSFITGPIHLLREARKLAHK